MPSGIADGCASAISGIPREEARRGATGSIDPPTGWNRSTWGRPPWWAYPWPWFPRPRRRNVDSWIHQRIAQSTGQRLVSRHSRTPHYKLRPCSLATHRLFSLSLALFVRFPLIIPSRSLPPPYRLWIRGRLIASSLPEWDSQWRNARGRTDRDFIARTSGLEFYGKLIGLFRLGETPAGLWWF